MNSAEAGISSLHSALSLSSLGMSVFPCTGTLQCPHLGLSLTREGGYSQVPFPQPCIASRLTTMGRTLQILGRWAKAIAVDDLSCRH